MTISHGAEKTEHGILMVGGDIQVRNPSPEVDFIYPLPRWIRDHQRHGGIVVTRTVIIVEDWKQVPR